MRPRCGSTRIAGGDLRRDGAALLDAVKATGFFPGPRVVLVEEATDAVAPAVRAALADWRAGDAHIVAAAGNLSGGSALRKAFEAARNAFAIGIYSDPPGREEIEAAVAAAGLARPGREAMADLEVLGRTLAPGDFAQFLEKLALYCDGEAPAPEDLAACAPASVEAAADALVALAAEGDARGIARALREAGASAGNPTGLTISLGRHFRTLYAAATAPGGPDAALSRARPPVFGPRRARMSAQARALGTNGIEKALAHVMEAELLLRSTSPLPAAAIVERLLVRIAMLRRGGQS